MKTEKKRRKINRSSNFNPITLIDYYFNHDCNLSHTAKKFNITWRRAAQYVRSKAGQDALKQMTHLTAVNIEKKRTEYIDILYDTFKNSAKKMTQYEAAKLLLHALGLSPEIIAIQNNVQNNNMNIPNLNDKVTDEQFDRYKEAIKTIDKHKQNEENRK